jgi:hypothetical protein
MVGDHMRPEFTFAILQDQDVCEGCGDYIMYYSPEQFDPVCTDEETGATHCEGCCACEEIETSDKLWGTGINFGVVVNSCDIIYKTRRFYEYI